MVEEQEFAESKNAQNSASGSSNRSNTAAGQPTVDPDGFMNIPDGIDEELPFS